MLCSAAYSETFYETIPMDITESEFIELYPAAVSEDDPHSYTFDGCMAVFFPESGRLKAKAIMFEAPADIPVSGFASDLASAESLKLSRSYESVCELFAAEGIEIMRHNESDADDSPEQIVYFWLGENSASVQCLFDSEMKLLYINYTEG